MTKWLKKPGDKVERDEPLFEISTDKVDTEIPSPAAGTLGDLLVQEGQTVQVNAVVARIKEAGDGEAPKAAAPPPPRPPAAPPVAEPPAVAAAPPPPPPPIAATPAETPKEPVGLLSPLVRRMARENNIDLSTVKGTGAGGRITKEDVEAVMKQAAAPAACAAGRPRIRTCPGSTCSAHRPGAADRKEPCRTDEQHAHQDR